MVLESDRLLSGVTDVTDEELDDYSEGLSDDGEIVTSEESFDDDDDDDGFAHLDY